MKESLEKRNIAKYKILSYMLNKRTTSKVELAKQLNLSMPTVLSNMNDLMEKGLIVEVGELESTGGRKARSLGLRKDYCYSLGINVTANHIALVLINLAGEMVKQDRIRMKFEPDVAYCGQFAEQVKEFLAGGADMKNVIGIGVALPGIIHKEERVLVKSHALGLENYSLKMMEQLLPIPVYFENDANAAMLAENPQKLDNAIYLSLNNTLGGAICMNGTLFSGQNQKAGEFGHMILVPGGKLCYCGKSGCADAYCAASVLTQGGKETLESFMKRVGKEKESTRIWEEYLDNLAILISNLRMAYDTDIILGGDVGGYLTEYMMELGGRIFKYNLFDGDLSYLRNCSYRRESAAVGVAKYFFGEFINKI